MAYYDLKTNEIWADSNIAGFHDEHIEIDEVIAPLIRELNIKGYKTKFCCSGHPFYSLCEAMVDSEETAKAFVGLIGTERTENPRVPVRALYVTPDNDFYITFEENEQKAIVLALPDGFEWDDERTIRRWSPLQGLRGKSRYDKKGSLPQNGGRLLDFCVRICYTV